MRSDRKSSHPFRVAAAALFCAGVLGCAHVPPGRPEITSPEDRAEAYGEIERLTEALLLIRKNYVDEVGYSNLVEGAMSGMIRHLDEHSSYMSASDVNEMQEGTHAKYGGIGLWIGVRDNRLVGIAPIEGTPAYRAGIRSLDAIVEIDGESTTGLSVADAVKKLRGEPGSKVVLAIQRGDEPQPRNMTLIRDIISVPTVKGTQMVRDGIGYLRIVQFSEPTGDLLRRELRKLTDMRMKALILDLRGNPGGLLKSAQDVAEQFLAKGALIVSVRDRNGKAEEKRLLAGGPNHIVDIPVAVLTDGGSASASEIVAGALKDHGRAILVGEKTYGKGTVQNIIPMTCKPGDALRLTTAKYYTPSEMEINGKGIQPDLPAPVTPEEWAGIQMRRMQTEEPGGYSEEEKAKYRDVVDTPLERAADVLQALLALHARE